MTLKQIASIAVTLISLTVTAYASAAEVELMFARGTRTWQGDSVKGYIEVENLAYEKEISVVYQVGNSGWKEVEASYVAPTHGNFEAWEFATEPVELGYKQSRIVQFAVRYEVADQIFWDNNNWNDYEIEIGYSPVHATCLLGSSRLFLDYAAWATMIDENGRVTRRTVHGAVFVENIAYEKLVTVVYTTDGWETVQYAPASFSRSLPENVERWGFMFDVPTDTQEVEFAMAYEVAGETYWDNNFQDNYTLTIPE